MKPKEAIEGDITRPNLLSKSSIDIIFISTVIHAFSQQQLQDFLREARRLLKPDGVLAIVEIEKKETPFGPPLEVRFSPEDLKELIPMAPLSTLRVGEHFYMQMFRNHEKQGSSRNIR